MSTNGAIRVLLVDDHALVRDGLKRLINDEPGMEIVGEARDGPEAVTLAQSIRPAVAVVDMSMPGWDGVRTTVALKHACPDLQIIILTRHTNPVFVQRSLQAGADGYVRKQSAAVELTAAIRAVAAGKPYVDEPIGAITSPASAPASSRTDDSDPPALTPLEEQVLRFVAAAHSNEHIGGQLGIPAAEVAHVKARAMGKARLATRLQVMRYAEDRGWKRPAD